MNEDTGIAKIEKIKRWSPVWIVPIVTALIGAWIVFYHFSHQGPQVTLIASSAEGLEGGKTAIKSRSVDVGRVESVTLNDDLSQVIIKARLKAGMEKLLHEDSVFWVVKPQVGREGISGLGTLLSGAYIELQPGKQNKARVVYKLLEQPPLASPDAKGIHIMLHSVQAGQLSPGDPVLFRGLRVGSVETSHFDAQERQIHYQLFIASPYDTLVTTNVKFWIDSGVSFDMSAQGMRVDIGSLTTLFSGGVSFDVPTGWEVGELARNKASYVLFPNQRSIQDSLYTRHTDVLMFFSDSIRGLQVGAPVEFRGIRLGAVAQAPYVMRGLNSKIDSDYKIPVLIYLEPDRITQQLGASLNVTEYLLSGVKNGLRASLKVANFLTGSLYVDLDFYPNAQPWKGAGMINKIPVLPTISGGFVQLQQKLTSVLDKINSLPLVPMITEATETLKISQSTLLDVQKMVLSLNTPLASKATQTLPQDIQQTLQALNRSLSGFQPGSPLYNKMVADMQRLDQVLQELQPVLRTLNEKSNALIFAAPEEKDPQPKKGTP